MFRRFYQQDGNDVVWSTIAAEHPKPNNDAKVFYFKTGPLRKVCLCYFDFLLNLCVCLLSHCAITARVNAASNRAM
jgi:hypothetical protein